MSQILIIEDELNIRETLQDILDASGYTVLTAKDGEEGIQKAMEAEPDLILCDVMMPKKTGLEVLQSLEQNSEKLPPPFIFLTAKSDHEDIRAGMNLGADDYLLKPFKMNELLGSIERNLAKRRNMNKQSLHQERERISTFLHDGVQQLLVVGHLNLSRIKHKAELSEREEKMLNQSSELISQAIDDMRHLSHGLVDDNTLYDCILESCDKINKSEVLKVNLYYQVSSHIPPLIKTTVFNAINESMNNVLKHAKATSCDVSVITTDRALEVEIKDNGKGFDSSAAAFGLKKMHNSISQIAGVLQVNSEAGKGTSLTFSIPL